MNFPDSWPEHIILMHIIPKHLIHTNFKNTLKVSIYSLIKHTTHTQFIHVQTSRMPIIKNLRMTQPMRRRTIKRLLTLQTSKQRLIQRPRIIKIILRTLTRHTAQIRQRQRTQSPLRIRSRTALRGTHTRKPTRITFTHKPGIVLATTQIHHPSFHMRTPSIRRIGRDIYGTGGCQAGLVSNNVRGYEERRAFCWRRGEE
mmetsp:Transcript_15814/g.20669  ORF Transcript_15814/g.20669 Transcript_15814/m.20669 type:complete len:200 (-) Transcript_15814:149-748(-)